MGPSGERDYPSISPQPLSPFPDVLLLQVGDGPVQGLRWVRQLLYGGGRMTWVFISSVCIWDPCKGASLCGDSAWQASPGVTQPSSRSRPPEAPILSPLGQVPTLEGGENQSSSQWTVSGASAVFPPSTTPPPPWLAGHRIPLK